MSSSERQGPVHRVIAHFRGNLIGWIALFVALGGTGYAAVSIPRNSVGAAQIRNRSITPDKFNPSAIGGSVRAWAIIRANATVLASSRKPVVFSSVQSLALYVIQWPVRLPQTCATVANVDERSPDQTPITLPNGGTAQRGDRLRQQRRYRDRARRRRAQGLGDQPRHVQSSRAAHADGFRRGGDLLTRLRTLQA